MGDQRQFRHRAPLGLDGAEEFRSGVCAWITSAMADAPADPRDRTGVTEAFERRLLAEAGRRGLLALDQPPEHAAAFAYEAAYHDAPLVDTGVVLAATAVQRFGSADQRAALLPAMTAGTETWCVAYTEPGAGNDLASRVAATAVPDGDGWRLDGVKALVTGAAKADRCLTVARTGTDARGRAVLTMFTFAMGTAGVRVRRRPTIAGYTLDEIRFEGVRLGPEAVVGEAGRGRRQLATAVRAEHGAVFHAGWADRMLHEFAAWCREAGAGAVTRDTLGALWARGIAARELALRPVRDPGDPVAPAVAKVALTEFLCDIAHVVTDVAGPAGGWLGSIAGPPVAGAPWGGRFAFDHLFRVDGPVSVGANELHRDAIARRLVADAGTEPDTAARTPPEAAGDGAVTALLRAVAGKGAFAGDGLRALLAAAEERAAAGLPGLAPVVLGRLLRDADGPAPGRADDDRHVDLACDGGPEATSIPVARNGRIRGRALPVPAPALYGDAPGLNLVVVVHTDTGPGIAVIGAGNEGVRHEPVPALGPHPSGVLHVDVAADVRPVSGEALAAARRAAALVAAAEAVGGARAALSVTVGRVSTRQAYGGVLSDLQAVRQRLAGMVIDLRSARAALDAAVRNPDPETVHAAKAHVNEAACRVTASAQQLCGGWGYLADAGGPGTAYRTAKAATFAQGGTHWHRARVADLLIGPSGPDV